MKSILNKIKEDEKLIISEYEKSIAVKDQNLSFAQTQLFESENQRKEMQKSYDALMKAFKTLESEADYNKDDLIQQQRNKYIEEISHLQSKFDEAKTRFTAQVEKLTKENNDLDFNLKMRISELKNLTTAYEGKIETLSKDKQILEESLKTQESDKLNLIECLEKQYKEKVKRLENDLSDCCSENIPPIPPW